MDENQNQSPQAAAEEQQQQQKAGEPGGGQALCKYCGAGLEKGDVFCSRCGEKAGGEEHACPICQTKTTAEMCPKCGNRVIPLMCPKCGAANFYDFCEKCGSVLNPEAEAFFEQDAAEPALMTEEEVRKAEAGFNIPESAEFKTYRQKLIEHQTLLEERDYFNKREKRIIKVLGSRPFSMELPDPAEEAFRMKAYQALEKTVIERQKTLQQIEWEKLFPEEKKIPVQQGSITVMKSRHEIDEEKYRVDLQRRREAMEERYKLLLSRVENEVEEFRISEEKRKEEERLRLEAEKREAKQREQERQREIERERLAQQTYENRFLGTYYYSDNEGSTYLKILSRHEAADTANFSDGHKMWGKFSVTINGSKIYLRLIKGKVIFSVTKSGFRITMRTPSFSGTINDSGTTISGYWKNGEYMTYIKC